MLPLVQTWKFVNNLTWYYFWSRFSRTPTLLPALLQISLMCVNYSSVVCQVLLQEASRKVLVSTFSPSILTLKCPQLPLSLELNIYVHLNKVYVCIVWMYVYATRKEGLRCVIDIFTQPVKKRTDASVTSLQKPERSAQLRYWYLYAMRKETLRCRNNTCTKSVKKGKEVLILIAPPYIAVYLT